MQSKSNQGRSAVRKSFAALHEYWIARGYDTMRYPGERKIGGSIRVIARMMTYERTSDPQTLVGREASLREEAALIVRYATKKPYRDDAEFHKKLAAFVATLPKEV